MWEQQPLGFNQTKSRKIKDEVKGEVENKEKMRKLTLKTGELEVFNERPKNKIGGGGVGRPSLQQRPSSSEHSLLPLLSSPLLLSFPQSLSLLSFGFWIRTEILSKSFCQKNEPNFFSSKNELNSRWKWKYNGQCTFCLPLFKSFYFLVWLLIGTVCFLSATF